MFDNLRPFASEVQLLYLDAIEKHGTERKAAKALNRHHSSIQDALKRLRVIAAAHGMSDDVRHNLNSPIPEPFIAKGHSTLERVFAGGERETVLQWTKTKLDDLTWFENVKSGVAAFMADQPPIAAPARAPKRRDQDIIPWIQIGDAHLGMLAHEAETGANFDLKIAQRELLAAIFQLIDESEPTERLVINDLGDFTHYENMAGVTDHSGHQLDYDGRFPKMIDVYATIMRAIIDKALTKANHVDVIVNQGNHSRTNDLWMAVLLRNVYGETGRVHVLNNRSPFIAYRMGRTFVMTHHSDTAKPNRLASVMATDYSADWGESDYRYIDIGHIHHNMVSKEHPGVQIESWNILAPKDKWANDGGYRSRQAISMVERSRTYGEKRRRILGIREVQDSIEAACLARGDAAPYRAPVLRAFAV